MRMQLHVAKMQLLFNMLGPMKCAGTYKQKPGKSSGSANYS